MKKFLLLFSLLILFVFPNKSFADDSIEKIPFNPLEPSSFRILVSNHPDQYYVWSILGNYSEDCYPFKIGMRVGCIVRSTDPDVGYAVNSATQYWNYNDSTVNLFNYTTGGPASRSYFDGTYYYRWEIKYRSISNAVVDANSFVNLADISSEFDISVLNPNSPGCVDVWNYLDNIYDDGTIDIPDGGLGLVRLTNYQHISDGSREGVHLEWDQYSTTGFDIIGSRSMIKAKIVYQPSGLLSQYFVPGLPPQLMQTLTREINIPIGSLSYDFYFDQYNEMLSNLFQIQKEYIKNPNFLDNPLLNYDMDIYLRILHIPDPAGPWLKASTNIFSQGAVTNNEYHNEKYTVNNIVSVTEYNQGDEIITTNNYYYQTTNNYTDGSELPPLSNKPTVDLSLPDLSSLWSILKNILDLFISLVTNIFELVPWLPSWVSVAGSALFIFSILITIIKLFI